MTNQHCEALQRLASYRARSSRESQDVVDHGALLLEKKSLARGSGVDADAWLEQLALAAIDVGRLELADQCIRRLSDKFPGSPRVAVLTGIRKEASLPAEAAIAYYDTLLRSDETNAAAWKRKIVVLRRSGDVENAAEELSKFLDTYYSDVEGWLELADIYASCNRYDWSLRALQHALLLAPQNPFYVLQAAETAYTAGDIPLAARFFLLVIDMTDDPDVSVATRAESVPEGIEVRAWFGVKQCTRTLIKDPRTASTSPTDTAVPQNMHLLDELATERLLTAYSTYSGGPRRGPVRGREELVKWLEEK